MKTERKRRFEDLPPSYRRKVVLLLINVMGMGEAEDLAVDSRPKTPANWVKWAKRKIGHRL